jgi:hypothetical protein
MVQRAGEIDQPMLASATRNTARTGQAGSKVLVVEKAFLPLTLPRQHRLCHELPSRFVNDLPAG